MKPLSEQEWREKLTEALETYNIDTSASGMDEDKAFGYFADYVYGLILQDRKAHEESIKNIIKMSDKYTFADGTVFVRQRNQGDNQMTNHINKGQGFTHHDDSECCACPCKGVSNEA